MDGKGYLVDYALQGRRVLLWGSARSTLDACATVLGQEGARVGFDPAGDIDIVIAAPQRHPDGDLLAIDVDQLYAAWDDVTEAVTAYRGALPSMARRGFGRFVWIGSAGARSVDSDSDELAAVVSLGMLGLHKVITGEVGQQNITANTVLRGEAAEDADVAHAVAFLCSGGASYLSGVAITVDGGIGSAVF